METISIFEIIERANLKREYIKALVRHVDKDAFMSFSTLEIEPWQGQIEDFLWNLMGLDLETITRIANDLVFQREPAFSMNGIEYKFSKDGTWTSTANGIEVAKGYWMQPPITPPIHPAAYSAV